MSCRHLFQFYWVGKLHAVLACVSRIFFQRLLVSFPSSQLGVSAELVLRLTIYIVGTPRLRTLWCLVLSATQQHLALLVMVLVLQMREMESLDSALAVTFALEVQ